MKGENYLYFNGHTAEPAADDRAMMIPASTVRGISVGGQSGEDDLNAVYLSAEGFVGDANSRAAVTIAVADGKQKEVMDDIAAAMASTPGDGFVVIADDHNGTYCSEYITGCTVDSAV